MEYLFSKCSSLKEVNLSNFNTSSVISMYRMFHGCSSLKKLNLSNFYTPNLLKISSLFYSLVKFSLTSFMGIILLFKKFFIIIILESDSSFIFSKFTISCFSILHFS